MEIGDTVLYNGEHHVKIMAIDEDGLIMVKGRNKHVVPVLEDELTSLKYSDLEKDILFGEFYD